MRSAIKRGVYRGLAALRVPQLARRLRPGATVLCLHNVVTEAEAGLGDASLHMPVEVFASIVEWLASSFDVVPLRELADRVATGRSVRGLAAITFDDAYRGVFEHALPLLASAGLPSTLFVVTGFADRPAPTWWDTLAFQGRLSQKRREEALGVQRGLAEHVLGSARGQGSIPALPEALLPAPWEQIVSSAGDLVAVGSHTVLHPNLTALEDPVLDEELGRSRRGIRERTGQSVEALAYPYGLWNPRVASAAGRAGYRIGLTLGGGRVQGSPDLLTTPRLNVPAGMSTDVLACWAAGIRLRRAW